MSSDLHNYGIIGFTSDNVGIDRRIYTGLTSTDPVLNVSYNGGRVDVYLNGIKLVGNHSEMPSGTRDYTFTQTGQGSSIQLRTGVALVSADVVECIGHVSGSGKTVSTYTPSVSAGNNTFNSSTTGMTGFTLQGSDLLNVYLNGVLLDSSDYTADASADSVAITNLASGDVVHIQVIGALDYANFVPAGGGTFSGDVAVNGDLTVDTNTLKVDATNNAVFVGQTSGYVGDSASASGLRMQTDGLLDVAKSGTYVIRVNRQSSDGEIISLRKDGTQVASIGSRNSSYGYFQFGDTGTAIGGTNSHKWLPIVNGVRSDNTTDIGDSTYRIKDIHLSGNVVIGSSGKGIDFSQGTTAPNTGGGTFTNTSSSHVLDQYERGYIDSPLYIGSSTYDSSSKVTGTYNNNSTNRLYWEKIGQVVTITYRVDCNPPKNAAGNNLTGTVRIKLPFTYNSGLAGSPVFANNEQGYTTTVFNGAWHPDAYVMYAYYAYGTEMRLVNNSQGISLYSQNSGTRLILNFTATYLSN